MNQIAFDVRMANHSGIGRYIRGTLSALLAHRPFHNEYVLCGPESFKPLFSGSFRLLPTSARIYGIREQIFFAAVSKMVDCLHIPHYNAPILKVRKLIITIHDLIHYHYPEYLPSPSASIYARILLPAIAKKADAIIAVSEYTKKDLVETFAIHPDKITVIHHGIDPAFSKMDPEKSKTCNQDAPFFLYVGLLKAHKNIGVLLDAFKQLRQKSNFEHVKLILVGTPDTKQNTVNKWLDMIQNDPDISLKTNIPDTELKSLYAHATALILPSLCEGFGFPLLEGMASGTPLIASRVGPLEEVMGEEGGLLFDPQSPSELERRMEQILSDDLLRRKLSSRGKERSLDFTWELAAKKTEHLYESVIGS